jgi:hypothetical protein
VELIDTGHQEWILTAPTGSYQVAFWTVPVVTTSWRREEWVKTVKAGPDEWVGLGSYPVPYEERVGYS